MMAPSLGPRSAGLAGSAASRAPPDAAVAPAAGPGPPEAVGEKPPGYNTTCSGLASQCEGTESVVAAAAAVAAETSSSPLCGEGSAVEKRKDKQPRLVLPGSVQRASSPGYPPSSSGGSSPVPADPGAADGAAGIPHPTSAPTAEAAAAGAATAVGGAAGRQVGGHIANKLREAEAGARAKDPAGTPSTCASLPEDVEVSFTTQMLLLTWARWGRNSQRIKTEERLKALQHVKYPRTPYRPRTPVASPQPTPRGHDENRATNGRSSAHAASAAAQRLVDRRQHGTGPPSMLSGSLFDDLRQEQRDAMSEQTARVKLCQTIGGSAVTVSAGTPGFGTKTPNFLGAKSRTSAETSVVSSGMVSPLAGGQLSPWILEAEALIEGNGSSSDNEQFAGGRGSSKQSPSTAHAWGVTPDAAALLEDLALPSTPLAGVVESVLNEAELPIEDEDELDKVELFVVGKALATDSAAQTASTFAPTSCATSPSAATSLVVPSGTTSFSPRWPAPPPRPSAAAAAVGSSGGGSTVAAGSIGDGGGRGDTATVGSTGDGGSGGLGGAAAEAAAAAPPPTKDELGGYSAGEKVSYWSKSHAGWKSAYIVERKSRSVYIIDKQGKGVLAKASASDLMSEAEMRRDPILRAVSVLGASGDSSSDEECNGRRTDKAGASRFGGRGSGQAQRGKREACTGRPPLPTAKRSPAGGQVIRTDFSDDDSEDGDGGGAVLAAVAMAARQQATASRGAGPAATVAARGATTQGSQQAQLQQQRRQPSLAGRTCAGRGGGSHGRDGLPAAVAGGRQPSKVNLLGPEAKARGRIVRPDFSDDDEDEEEEEEAKAEQKAAARLKVRLAGRVVRTDFSDDSDDG